MPRLLASIARVASIAASLLFAPLVHAAEQARFTRGPYLQDVGSRQATILFELEAPHAASLEVARGVSATDDAGQRAAPTRVSSVAPDRAHELVVGGLEPATAYRYEVKVDDGTTRRGTFTTAPEDDRPISFLVYGDNRSNGSAHAAVVKAMVGTPGDFLVQTGDMVQDGSDGNDWATFFSIERDLLVSRPLFTAIGNHEIAVPGSDGATRYAHLFRVPGPPGANERYYSFRWGTARFFVLDSHEEFAEKEKLWLEGALDASDKEPGVVWRFAVVHHGPYSAGLHGGSLAMRVAKIPELLRAHALDAIFAGHDHIYERGDASGLKFVVTGGGGAPLYQQRRADPTARRFEAVHHFLRMELTKSLATMTATRVDGSVIERCSFAPHAGAWSCGGASGAQDVAGAASAGALPPPASQPPVTSPSRSCRCSLVGGDVEWIAPLLAAGLVAAAALGRRARRGEG